jgi:drug/metabolite transporter (DMT)-like permease
MSALLLGLAIAAIAAILYAVGVTLQSLEAREAPDDERLHHDLFRRLVARPRWLAGTACAVLAWVAQTAALALAPLTLVQPSLALGLVVLLIIGARLKHERVGWREMAGVAAIVFGLAGLAWASPSAAAQPAPTGTLVAAIGCFAVLAIGPYALRRHLHGRDWVITVAAGLAFAWSAQASKFVADAAVAGAWALLVAALAATVAGALLGLLNEMTALQGSGAVRVYPTVLVIQIVVAVTLAPALLGESWTGTPFGGLALGLSLAVVVGGAASLVSARAVGSVAPAPT